ncbi:MAG: DUF4114 domain-containing protein [Candidatus Bathyarchaeales archaeon]
MRRFTFAFGLLAALVLFEFLSLGFAGSQFVVLADDGEPSLQEWFDQNGYAINVVEDETGIETFPAGFYGIRILAEIADYAPVNNLSWYLAEDAQLNLIFVGENTTGETAYFVASASFGLCLGSPDGYFYTEAWRNNDGKDHALVFVNPNAPGYIIAWEDLSSLGDADFQDFILAVLTPVNVSVRFCPRTLNLKSKGRWITAIVKLPKNHVAADVNFSSILLNGTIQAEKWHFCKSSRLIVLKFNRATVIELVKESLKGVRYKKSIEVSLTLTGKFLDGMPFQGTGKIRVINLGRCGK